MTDQNQACFTACPRLTVSWSEKLKTQHSGCVFALVATPAILQYNLYNQAGFLSHSFVEMSTEVTPTVPSTKASNLSNII